ncbi:hypothetical protein HY311_00880 [Candidatus Nomurabacteria bacterium]|nr:hypothetical protein [Candidatus Nomurabacteria bacterium]
MLTSFLDFDTKEALLVGSLKKYLFFMDNEEEEVLGEDGFQINDDGDLDPLDEIADFGLDEEDPDKDR